MHSVLHWIWTNLDKIGGVVTFVGAVLTFIGGIKARKTFTVWAGIVTLFGSLLSLLSGFSSTQSQAAFQKQVADSQQKILQNATDINTQVSDASGKLKDLQQNLGDEKKAVSDLTDDVNTGTRKVLGATKQATDAITGGKAYCYVAILPDPLNGNPNMLKVYLLNPGTKPVYDVSYTIMKVLPHTPSIDEIKELFRTQQSGFAPVVFGGQGNGLLNPTQVYVAPGEYGVHIWMRNGEITERVKMVYDGKKWIDGTVVKRDSTTLKSFDTQNLTTPF